MNTLAVYFINLGVVTTMMVLGWLVSLKTENVTLVDSLWGMGFVLIAWLCLVLGDGSASRGRLLVIMVLRTS